MNQNFDKNISLAEVARLTNMTAVSFSRFIKTRTGMTLIDSLTEMRMSTLRVC